METEDKMAEVMFQGGLISGKPYIILNTSVPEITMTLEDAKALLQTFAACISTTESGYKRSLENGETKET